MTRVLVALALLALTLPALRLSAQAAGAAEDPAWPTAKDLPMAQGRFQPEWESLKQYECPDWFRDAKFGIWACWSPQCVPEQGDWYARNMYMQGSAHYNYHVQTYGHPSKFGYKDICNLWKGEKWDPERLMQLYKDAGAKYFTMMANHHCNFDAWDSKIQPWNSVNIGPKKDIVGIFAEKARKYGLRFGVTVHNARTWDWFDVAHGSDKTGPLAGVPYDGCLTKADGKGTWWEGYDPADLYGPAGAARTPAAHKAYVTKWYLGTKELLDNYHPDLLYFDDGGLPLGEAGMRIGAHFYNANRQWHNGKLDAVLNIKGTPPGCRSAVVLDLERGLMDKLEPFPWQTDTCIGDWHYRRGVHYKTAAIVVPMLVDIVSKNGNLLLNIPIRGDGSIDDEEVGFLKEMAQWMAVNSECIFGTRPWLTYGEGSRRLRGGAFNEGSVRYAASDIRFTTKGNTLYAIALGWPEDGKLLIRSLAAPKAGMAGRIDGISLLGFAGKLQWARSEEGLSVTLPARKPCEHAFALKIAGQGLKPAPIPEDAPPVFSPGPDGKLKLLARDAAIHGESPQYEVGGGKDNIGYWGDANDFVSWEVKLPKAGAFTVEVAYSCANGAEGSEYAVEVAGRQVVGKSKATGDWAAFTTEKIGRIEVPAPGAYTLSVKPKTPPQWKVIGLKSVTLIPEP